MTNLNNDTCELNLNELDAVTGGRAGLYAYLEAIATIAIISSRPAVETETGCGK